MRRFWLAAILGLVACLLLISAARAGSTTPAVWWWQQPVIETPVEQQTPCLPDGTHCGSTNPDESVWVVNPTRDDVRPCAWDADDRLLVALGANALLRPGESATSSVCVFADSTVHGIALQVNTPGLVGILTVPGYASVTVQGGQTGCISTPDYNATTVPSLPLIADSNGGHAERVVATFTVTNPTERRVRDGYAAVGVFLAGFQFVAEPWCPYPWYSQWTQIRSAEPQVWRWVG